MHLSKAGHQIQNVVPDYVLHYQMPSTGSRDGTNCFAVTLGNITELDSSPNENDSRAAFLQHQISLLNLRNLSIRSKAPLCQVLLKYRGQHLQRKVNNLSR